MKRLNQRAVAAISALSLVAALPLVAAVSAAAAGDWPRFRGPNAAGVTEAANLPVQFGPGAHVVWKTALPPGKSSPVLAEGRIYLTGQEGGKLLTLALDRVTGKILWRREITKDRAERSTNSTVRPRPRPRPTARTSTPSSAISALSPTAPTVTNVGACRWARSTTSTAWPLRRCWPAID